MVKYKYLSADPGYLTKQTVTHHCCTPFGCICPDTYSATIQFRLINMRTPYFFVFYGGATQPDAPCIYKTSGMYKWSNSGAAVSAHLAAVDSFGTRMRVTWVSGDGSPQQLYYGATALTTPVSSSVQTFGAADMCAGGDVELDGYPTPLSVTGAATQEGFHNPGFIHSALVDLTGTSSPGSSFVYYYGRSDIGFSGVPTATFLPPPGASATPTHLVVFGDMGKNEKDGSNEHFTNPGALSVISAIATYEASAQGIFHIGDISYATGYLTQWDEFLENISPISQRAAYMTAIGNHERDWPDSGDIYGKTDSGGECGVPYFNYFPMPGARGG